MKSSVMVLRDDGVPKDSELYRFLRRSMGTEIRRVAEAEAGLTDNRFESYLSFICHGYCREFKYLFFFLRKRGKRI